MKKTEFAYIAGIVDGEGSIGITRPMSFCSKKQTRGTGKRPDVVERNKKGHEKGAIRCPYVQVSVANTNEWLIHWLHFNFGGSIYCEQPGKNPLSKRACWRWNITNKKAAEFLKLVLPYLKIKQEQAELAILFQSNKIPSKKVTDEQRAVEETQRLIMVHHNKH